MYVYARMEFMYVCISYVRMYTCMLPQIDGTMWCGAPPSPHQVAASTRASRPDHRIPDRPSKEPGCRRGREGSSPRPRRHRLDLKSPATAVVGDHSARRCPSTPPDIEYLAISNVYVFKLMTQQVIEISNMKDISYLVAMAVKAYVGEWATV